MCGTLLNRFGLSLGHLAAVGISLLLAPIATAQKLSPLAAPPNWGELEPYQETMTREEFVHLLNDVFAPGGAAKEVIDVQMAAAVVKTSANPPGSFRLRFAEKPEVAKPAPRIWRTAKEMGSAAGAKPLAGVKIAIDPGHIGGKWARIEERSFQVGESRVVAEGDMTLRVAKLLQPRLEALGAEVRLVRTAEEPVTPKRPDDLRPEARAELARMGIARPPENYRSANDPLRARTVQAMSEILFYRTSEIRYRAKLVNEEIRPDLTLCLHFNAEPWGEPGKPDFVPRNHFHVILNGCYSVDELRHEDVRFDMLQKLLSRSFEEELAAGSTVAETFARESQLPAYTYTTPNAVAVGGGGYLWARNLLANRLYRTPVVFLEPFVMNSELVWERVQAGDYEGEILLGGELRKSIFREYADAVADGLKEYYSKARPAP